MKACSNLAAGANPMVLKKGIEAATEAAVAGLREQSQPVAGKQSIAQVAAISAADDTIGKLISDAMETVGNDGVITVEESKTMTTGMTTAEGMQFDRGYASAYMVTDTDKMEAVLDNPLILITDKKISNIQELLPLLEQVVQSGKKLLIIAEDVEGEALSTLVAQQAARHLHLRGRQGAWLWRSPQGNAPRYRYPDRWPGHYRGTGPGAEGRLPWICWARLPR